MLNLPIFQHFIAVSVAKGLSDKLQTEVSIGRVDLGLLNRVIIDDIQLNDRSKHELLTAGRFSVKFELMPLFKGNVIIHSVQLFGFNIRLNKLNPKAKPNYQFLIDAFSSKKKSQPSNLKLRINSIILRRGRFSYDVFSERQTPGKFNVSHIRLHNISANLGLKVLQKDSVNIGVRRLSFDGESGVSVDKLSFKLAANSHEMLLQKFALEFGDSRLQTEDIHLTYNNFDSFKHFADQVHFAVRTKQSYITMQDISMFVPALKNFEDRMNFFISAKGSLNNLTISRFTLDAGRKLQLQMNGLTQGTTDLSKVYFSANLPNMSINSEGMNFITRNFINKKGKLPAILNNLGDINFKGKISGYLSQITMAGLLHSAIGTLKTDLRIGHQNKYTYTYRGDVNATDLDLGKFLDNKKWGQSTFDIKVDAVHRTTSRYPAVMVKGLISSLCYNNYCYKNINVNGLYKGGGFDGKVGLDDPNGSFHLNGNFNLANKTPEFHFSAVINKLRPNDLNITNKYKNAEISMRIKANFTGGSIDRMKGALSIDSLSFVTPQKSYYMRSLNITSSYQDNQKTLTLKSDMADAEFTGKFQYSTFTSSVKNLVSHYLPSLIPPTKGIKTNNNFKFNINIYNTEILPTVFDIPVHIGSYSRLFGYVDDNKHLMHVEGFIPHIRYSNHELQSGYVLFDNPSNKFHASVRFNEMRKSGAISYALNTYADNDTLNTTLSWGNNASQTYSGSLQAMAHFLKSSDRSHLKAIMDVKSTNVIINDTTWQIHPSQVTLDKGYIDINNFSFSHNDRYIHINGRLSSMPSDTVKVDLQDINLTYLFGVLNFDDADFKGEVSGHVSLCELTKKPQVYGNLAVRNFTFNDGPIGDGSVIASWDREKQGVSLDAHLSEPNVSKTHIAGYIFPTKGKSGLDLTMDAENTNMKFVQYYLSSIFDDLNGRMTGKAHLSGKFSELNLSVDALADANVKVGILDTYFYLKDSLIVTPTGIHLKNTKLYDSEGHQGTGNGYITYKYLRDFAFRLQFNFNNMLVMNTHETEDLPFYGKIYATGNAVLQGGSGKGLDVTTAIRTNKNSTFVYINRNTTSAINNQFITFIDKTPRRVTDTIEVINPLEDVLKNVSSDIHLNLLVDATPDATLKIIMDPVAGDNIIAKGSGNIRGEYYNKGNFRMFGTYVINQGNYKFSLQEVIRKDFSIREGSTITFNGPPLDATLNVKAAYAVNSASLSDLIPSATSIVKQNNIKVNCLLNLTGLLPHPTINFDLELPNERDEIQTLVRNYIGTEEQMNTQILYLLSIGKFYMQENTTTNQNSNMMSSVLSSTLSGQLNNILSQVIDNNNWNFGTNLSTGQNGWTDMEVEGVLSGRLLNNRLIVNGNFGYRDNPLSNSNFIGDFEAEWLLSRSGSIRLKAYNETNDRYYTKTNLTTQGIGIILQKDFDKWSDLFFWNRWKLKALKSKKKAVTTPATVEKK